VEPVPRNLLQFGAQTLAFGRLAMFSTLTGLLIIYACGSSPAPAVTSSPTPDSATRSYIALVHNYWIQYKAAEADPIGNSAGQFSNADAAKACFGLRAPNTSSDAQLIDPPTCRDRSVAMVAVHEKFLSDLDATPPPPKFRADDQAFRSQLPKAIADVNAMISAATTGSKDAVLQATAVYVNDMIPIVTDALDDVDSSVVHT
jgi:hypothetical protein